MLVVLDIGECTGRMTYAFRSVDGDDVTETLYTPGAGGATHLIVRVVLDTNTLVSGVISAGSPPRQLLDGARTQAFEICSSAVLLAEETYSLARNFLRALPRPGYRH